MKTIKYLSSLALLSALALASCTNDQDPAKTDHLPQGVVYLTGSIAGQNAARATINTNGSGTFTDGDVWGMSTLVNNQVVNDNMEYTYATTKLFWEDLSRTDDVTFLAQYPGRLRLPTCKPTISMWQPRLPRTSTRPTCWAHPLRATGRPTPLPAPSSSSSGT